MLELILADQLPDLPQVVACSAQEWQFHISSVRAHIGTSAGRSTQMVKASSEQEWQFYIPTAGAHIGRSTGRSSPPHSGI